MLDEDEPLIRDQQVTMTGTHAPEGDDLTEANAGDARFCPLARSLEVGIDVRTELNSPDTPRPASLEALIRSPPG
jgi:hypothetical protein